MVRLIDEIQFIYRSIQAEIVKRLEEFQSIWLNGTEKVIFRELVFCLLTPQSKAHYCGNAVQTLIEKDLLFNGSEEEISQVLNIVRFRNNKARYIVKARKQFLHEGQIKLVSILNQFETPFQKREWLYRNVLGMGIKEASHFLRNIGPGEELAILDRHILKNLVLLKVIDTIHTNLSISKYLTIESQMKKFSLYVEIPLSHLDFVLWYKETKDIYK